MRAMVMAALLGGVLLGQQAERVVEETELALPSPASQEQPADAAKAESGQDSGTRAEEPSPASPEAGKTKEGPATKEAPAEVKTTSARPPASGKRVAAFWVILPRK